MPTSLTLSPWASFLCPRAQPRCWRLSLLHCSHICPPFGISPPLNTSCLVASWPWNCQWSVITYCDMRGKPDLCRYRNEGLSEVRHVQPSFPPQWACDGAATQVLPALGPSDKELQQEGFHRKEPEQPCVRPLSALGRKCHLCRMRADPCSYCSCPPPPPACPSCRCQSPHVREAVRGLA